MSSISILPDRVANQIAAGEVIERPAAVIKELLENSLDAESNRVEVEFRHGGRSYMRVEDDGFGMSRDDALIALERHATSKIRDAGDLDRVASFGFRGEALPSIASVSRFLLRTRREGEKTGTEILVNGGKIVHVRDCGMPAGTRIEVSQLFNSVPARRKFLKTDNTESGHIVHYTRLYALACPQVAFTLIGNGRVLFRSPGCHRLDERIGEVFGERTVENLLEVEAREEDLKLAGYISKPGVGRSTRHEMVAFVNRRPVDSRTLSYAVLESYHASLVKGRYPQTFLFLDIDPGGVDVNVHPAKREIRFRDETRVRRFVIHAVLAGLQGTERPRAQEASSRPADGESGTAVSPPREKSFAPRPAAVPSALRAASPESAGSRQAGALPPGPRPSTAETPAFAEKDKPAESAAEWRYLGLAHARYAVFETGEGVVLMDRHAALERVAYEEILSEYERNEPTVQSLLFAAPLELDAIGTALLIDHLDLLKKSGFGIEVFGRNCFRIESVPAWIDADGAVAFVRDLVGLMRDGNLPEDRPAMAREQIARLAARAARTGERATAEEMSTLVRRLMACRQPLTNPRGRPTFIEIGRGELERRFQKRV